MQWRIVSFLIEFKSDRITITELHPLYACEGFRFDAEQIKKLASSYLYLPSPLYPSLPAVCLHNAEVSNNHSYHLQIAKQTGLSAVSSIWESLCEMIQIEEIDKSGIERVRAGSSVSPRQDRSRTNSISSTHRTYSGGDISLVPHFSLISQLVNSNQFISLLAISNFSL